MKVEDLSNYLESKKVSDEKSATHVIVTWAGSSRFLIDAGSTVEDREALARVIYEANRLKVPLCMGRGNASATGSLRFVQVEHPSGLCSRGGRLWRSRSLSLADSLLLRLPTKLASSGSTSSPGRV